MNKTFYVLTVCAVAVAYCPNNKGAFVNWEMHICSLVATKQRNVLRRNTKLAHENPSIKKAD